MQDVWTKIVRCISKFAFPLWLQTHNNISWCDEELHWSYIFEIIRFLQGTAGEVDENAEKNAERRAEAEKAQAKYAWCGFVFNTKIYTTIEYYSLQCSCWYPSTNVEEQQRVVSQKFCQWPSQRDARKLQSPQMAPGAPRELRKVSRSSQRPSQGFRRSFPRCLQVFPKSP